MHSYQDIYEKGTKLVLGEIVPRKEYTNYRKCTVCGKIQKGTFTSQGVLWEHVYNEDEINVINNKLENGEVFL